MDTHPVTILVGIVGGVCLLFLVSLGLSCSGYKLYPQEYEILKPYYEYAKSKRMC